MVRQGREILVIATESIFSYQLTINIKHLPVIKGLIIFM